MDEMATYGLGDVEERENVDGSMLENPAAADGELRDKASWLLLDSRGWSWTTTRRFERSWHGKTVEASRTAGGTKAKCFCRRSPTTRTWTYHCKGGRRSGRGNASWAVFEQMGELEGFVTAVAHQLRTYIHDILSPHHEKAWRCFPWRTCGRLS